MIPTLLHISLDSVLDFGLSENIVRNNAIICLSGLVLLGLSPSSSRERARVTKLLVPSLF